VSVLAEGEEERVQEVVVEDDDERVTHARAWDKDVWERELKELAKGSSGRMVVPMTSGEGFIDNLPPPIH
jgi:mRNA m6A methyltransferase non-catalytic subunit